MGFSVVQHPGSNGFLGPSAEKSQEADGKITAEFTTESESFWFNISSVQFLFFYAHFDLECCCVPMIYFLRDVLYV